MGDLILHILGRIIELSIGIIMLPFLLVGRFIFYNAWLIPYLIYGVVALLASLCALGVVAWVLQWVYLALYGVYWCVRKCIPKRKPKPAQAEATGSEDAAPEPDAKDDDPYRILGAARGMSPEEIQRRYRDLLRRNHPDRVAQLDPQIQEFANQRTQKIVQAYEAIAPTVVGDS